jgi:hypothetical protein
MKVRFRSFGIVTALAVAAVGITVVIRAQEQDKARALRARLSRALADEDAAAIRQAVADLNRHLGEKAGVPETPDKYVPIPKAGKWLTADEAAPGLEPDFKQIEKFRWWKIGLDPTKLGHALREPAAIASGSIAVSRAKLKAADRCLELAKEAGDFLIWAQEQGGTGVFPFPASRGVSEVPEFLAAERYMKQAEKNRRLDAVVKNGWAINDDGDGGLQFDNGECGVAMLELYEFTKGNKYLESAKKAADWALSRPLVANWNYNSFSVYLLARTYRVTGEKKYLEAATKKALLGVIPGQLTEGPHAGRWNDAHNARPGYHYIMLRSLTELAIALPQTNADRAAVLAALKAGLIARNKVVPERGVLKNDKALETLLIVNRSFAEDREFLRDTASDEALDALAKVVSEQSRRGNSPAGPREWGHFLEYVVWRSGR